MRWLFCFLGCIILSVAVKAQQSSLLQKEIVLPKEKYTLQEIFDIVEAQNVIVAYGTETINTNTPISTPFTKISLSKLLNYLDKNYAINAKVKPNKIIFTQRIQRFTISGYITEYGSRETLVGANILLNNNYGAYSNAYGFYSLTLPEGEYQIAISYIGYIPKTKKINLTENTQLNFSMQSASQQLSEVIVKPQKTLINQREFSRINLEKTNISPIAIGADDAIKRLHTIPGTGGGITGFSELSVRGGNVHENLVLLDGVPVYNYNHFPGLLSIFNTEALKSIDFYKGQFPARYVGRLSSVTDIQMREGNMEDYHIGGSLDLTTLSMFVEGPILKNKASFIVSGRRSWIDALTSFGNKEERFDFHLQDINLKTNYVATENDRLYLSLYRGVDKLGDNEDDNFDDAEKLSWTNNITALKWNHVFSEKIFCNTLLAFSKFNNTATETDNTQTNQSITNKYILEELSLATDVEYYGELYQFRFGAGFQKNIFEIPVISETDDSQETEVFQWKWYMENKIKFTDAISGNIGLNYVFYQTDEKNRHFFQPRINLNYQLSSISLLSLGFSEMYQFIHQLGTNTLNLPYAFRLPASDTFLPGTSRLYELKYTSQLRKQKDNFYASLYYKKQKNILRYKLGQDLFNKQLADDWENQVVTGQQKVFGFETSYDADLSPLLVKFSYTFSKNEEQFRGINNNKYYQNALTPRHIFMLNAEYYFNKKHSVSAMGEYNTGRYINIPIYQIEDIDQAINKTYSPHYTYAQGKVNGFQLKDNYHIDLGYTFQSKESKNGRHILKLGVYSLLGRLAPFRAATNVFDNQLTIEEVSLPSPMPYFSYTFKF